MQRMINFAIRHGLIYLNKSLGCSSMIGCSFWAKGNFIFTDYDDEKMRSTIEYNGTIKGFHILGDLRSFFFVTEEIEVMELESMMRRVSKNASDLNHARSESLYRLDLAIKNAKSND